MKTPYTPAPRASSSTKKSRVRPGDGLTDEHRAQEHDAVEQHQGRADAVEP